MPLLDQGCLYWENLLKGKVRSVVMIWEGHYAEKKKITVENKF